MCERTPGSLPPPPRHPYGRDRDPLRNRRAAADCGPGPKGFRTYRNGTTNARFARKCFMTKMLGSATFDINVSPFNTTVQHFMGRKGRYGKEQVKVELVALGVTRFLLRNRLNDRRLGVKENKNSPPETACARIFSDGMENCLCGRNLDSRVHFSKGRVRRRPHAHCVTSESPRLREGRCQT